MTGNEGRYEVMPIQAELQLDNPTEQTSALVSVMHRMASPVSHGKVPARSVSTTVSTQKMAPCTAVAITCYICSGCHAT